MDEFLTEFKKGQMKPAYYVQGGYRVLEVQNNDKKVQNSIKIPFTFPARSDSNVSIVCVRNGIFK